MKTRFSMKAKFLAILGGLSFLFVLFGFSWSYTISTAGKQKAMERVESLNSSLRASLGSQFAQRYNDAQIFANNGNLLAVDAGIRTATLNKYISLNSYYDLVMLVDKKGDLVSVNTLDGSGKGIKSEVIAKKNFADTDWFKNTIQGKFIEGKGLTGTYIEDAQFDPITSEVYSVKLFGNSFSAQVKSPTGEIVGVLSVRANFRWAEDEIEKIYSKINQSDSAVPASAVYLVNGKGQVLAEFNGKTFEKNQGYKRETAKLAPEAFDFLAGTDNEAFLKGNNFSRAEYVTKANLKFYVNGAPIIEGKFIEALGWKTLVSVPTDAALDPSSKYSTMYLGIFFAIGVFGLLLGFRFANGISKQINAYAIELKAETEEVDGAAQKVSQAASGLAKSTNSQASAIQETVAAIDEVNAMAAKCADSAKDSLTIMTTSKESAEKGKGAIDAMLNSMRDIQESNGTIVAQVAESNSQLNSIVNLIGEIGQKTKVINDIVFQTKLLSFNASVEAARAGEMGKGFAVVAEEVGNLAQMSGSAAKEITQLLENSVKQVEQIAEDSKNKISFLMESNKEKVSTGATNATRCAEIFTEIMESVNKVGQIANEIAHASKEQSLGVNEINKSMNQLSSLSAENANGSQQSLQSSDRLKGQADKLKTLIQNLVTEIGETKTVSRNSISRDPVLNVAPNASKEKPFFEAQPSQPSLMEKKKDAPKIKLASPGKQPVEAPLAKANTESIAAPNVIEMKPKAKSAPAIKNQKSDLKAVAGGTVPAAEDPRFEDV